MELIVSDIEVKENEILPIKFTNYEELKKEIVSKMQEYKEMTVTEEGIKEAKEYRANLNKFKKAIADQRIAKNKEVEEKIGLSKYNTECKELEKYVSDASNFLDSQIKAYEEKMKNEKLKIIVNFFDENAGEYEKLINFDNIYNEKWLNTTYKMEQIQQEILHVFSKAKMDVQTIDGQMKEEVINKQVKDFYFKNIGNPSVLSLALQEGVRIVEANERLEALKNLQNLTKSTENITNSSQNITISQTNTTKNEKIRRMDFSIETTLEQLTLLKNFCVQNNIKILHGITEEDVLDIVENIDTYIQDCREEGDTDLRSILHYTQEMISSISKNGTIKTVKYLKNESEDK